MIHLPALRVRTVSERGEGTTDSPGTAKTVLIAAGVAGSIIVLLMVLPLLFSSNLLPAGSTPPDLTVTELFSSAELDGREQAEPGALLLVFGLTTCSHCTNQVSHIITLISNLNSSQLAKLSILSVFLDDSGDATADDNSVKSYATSHSIAWNVTRTPYLAGPYMVTGVPTIYIINANWTIHFSRAGEVLPDPLQSEIEAVIGT